MKSIILAAGRGSRMGSLTQDRPKCLTSLAGKTLLDWQLTALRGAGIVDNGIVRGYLGDRLPGDGIHFFENPRWSSSNMVRSLLCASSWLESGPCIISYSDIVYRRGVVEGLMRAPAEIAVAYDEEWADLWKARFADPLSDAETFRLGPGGTILEIGLRAKTLGEIQGQYMGLIKTTAAGWRRVKAYTDGLSVEAVDKLDMTSLLRHLIERGASIQGVATRGGWYEVDSDRDLQLYEDWVKTGNSWLSRAD